MEKIGNICMELLWSFWDIMLASSVFILFGFFVAGLLKGFIPSNFIERHLGGKKKTGILKASLFGIPIPLCSCGVIPVAAGLRQQKAGKGAVTSFMISTPETGVDSIAVTYALLDPVMTIARPVSALITAIVTGLMVNVFDRDNEQSALQQPQETLFPMSTISTEVHSCGCGDPGCGSGTQELQLSIFDRLKKGMAFSFGNLLSDIGPWLLFGVGLASVITIFVSPEFIRTYLGGGIMPMFVMIALATPLYVCATASTPIAAALAIKGLSPGAALVFLLAGPATNIATFTVVAKLLGKKTAVIYVASIMVCSLLLGLAVNWLYFTMGLSIAGWVHVEHYDSHGIIFRLAAIGLLGLIVRPWIVKVYDSLFSKTKVHPAASHQQHNCHCDQ